MLTIIPQTIPNENPEAGQHIQSAGKDNAKNGQGLFSKLLAGLRKNISDSGSLIEGSSIEEPHLDLENNGKSAALKTKAGKKLEVSEAPGNAKNRSGAKTALTGKVLDGAEPDLEKTVLARSGVKKGTSGIEASDPQLILESSLAAAANLSVNGGEVELTDAFKEPADSIAARVPEPDNQLAAAVPGPVANNEDTNPAQGIEQDTEENLLAKIRELGVQSHDQEIIKTAASAQLAPAQEAEENDGPPVNNENGRKNRVRLEVRDTRTKIEIPASLETGRTAKPVEAPVALGRETEFVLNLQESGQNAGDGARSNASQNVSSQTFSDLLSGSLQNGLSDDIVKQASLMVRDGGEGTIRLTLKPEHLGNVKIRLEMTDNKIVGRIIVESDEALHAFEREIHAMEQSFKDSGFDSANLEMLLDSGGNRGTAGDERAFYSERLRETASREAASVYDNVQTASGFGFNTLSGSSGDARINMLA